MRWLLLLLPLWFALPAYGVEFEHDGVKLGTALKSLPKAQYSCAKSFLAGEIQCTRKEPGTLFGIPARKVELMFKNGRCYIIFVGFAPADTPKVGQGLSKKYGSPSKATNVRQGVEQIKWEAGSAGLTLNRDDKRDAADMTIIKYD